MGSLPEPCSGALRRTLRLLPALVEEGLGQLRAHWRQHLLTLIGLVWGSAAVVLLLSLGSGFYRFLDLGFKKTGDRYTMVVGEYTTSESGGTRPGRRIVLTRDDFARLRASVPAARYVAAELDHGSVAARTPYRTKTAVLKAATADIRHIKVLRVARGRFYDERDVRDGRAVVVLGANLPAVFFGAEDPLGQTIHIEGKPFEVIGVLQRKGPQLVINNGLHDDILFVPLSAGQRLLKIGKEVGEILLHPRRLEDVETMHAEARPILWARHHVMPDDEHAIRLQNIGEFSGPLRRIASGLTILLGFIGTITLAMAGVGIANLMIALVNARRIELAMRRACGARRGDVMRQLLVETLVIVLCGGACGIAVASALVLAIGLLPLPEMIPEPRLSASVLATTFLVLIATGLIAGLAPARLAARVDPASALRVT